jgi:hypothetical protein
MKLMKIAPKKEKKKKKKAKKSRHSNIIFYTMKFKIFSNNENSNKRMELEDIF